MSRRWADRETMKPARRHKDPWKRQPDVTAVVEEAEAQETQKHRRQSSRPTTLKSRPDLFSLSFPAVIFLDTLNPVLKLLCQRIPGWYLNLTLLSSSYLDRVSARRLTSTIRSSSLLTLAFLQSSFVSMSYFQFHLVPVPETLCPTFIST